MMKLHTTLPTLAAAALLLAPSATAQLLSDGNSDLPACAQQCQLLNQAAQACGGVQSANQQIWSCFCQSAYLTSLKTSPTGICDAVCTNPDDNQQVMTWYNSNCGDDYGATAHADSGSDAAGGTTTTAGATAGPSSSLAVYTSTAVQPTATRGFGTEQANSGDDNEGTWWDNHYKWIIMLIAIFVGLLLVALIAVWLKRRHDRKQDQIRGGFNEGITTRPAHHRHEKDGGVGYAANDSTFLSNNDSQFMPGSGRDSPARTREAFMPYGYGYARSESRVGSRADVDASAIGRETTPAAPRGGTPANEMEKGDEIQPAASKKPGQRRVLVRERSMQEPMSPVEER